MTNSVPPESQFINQQNNSPSCCSHWETFVPCLSWCYKINWFSSSDLCAKQW